MNKNYKLGYNLLMSAFAEENLDLGVLKVLQIIQQIFQCKEVSIYKIDNYNIINNYSYPNDDYDFILSFFRKNINLLNNKKDYRIELNDNMFNRLSWFHLDNNYFLVVINSKNNDNLINSSNMEIIKKTLNVILKNELFIHKLIKSTAIDELTGLENRMAFNQKVKEYNESTDNVVFVMLDLFRLKYINDTFGHDVGDLFIKKTANILKQYFPKYKYNNLTGDNIYRIGGDEFVILSKNKNKNQIINLLDMVVNKVENLDLNINENPSISINYGIAERDNNQLLEELYKLSDESLSQNKKDMYKQLKIDRRQ